MPPEKRELDDTLPASDAPPADSRAPGARTAGSSRERYQLGAELGRGGMGRVVEAIDTQLGRTVALKEILPRVGDAHERRFLREVQVTARLEHPSIVPLYDAGVGSDGRPFYVMRRVTGRPLDELIGRARSLDERLTLLPAVIAAIEAVAHAHRRGVLHRDLKPGNILVGELGETVVIDWGLAKVIGEPDEDDAPAADAPAASDSLHTQLGAVFGTPGFMAPEQARGETLGTHGDVYALGATLYQLLAGAPPHLAKSATEMLDKTMRHDVTPVRALAPGAPVELVAIVDKALAFDAANRYPDAGALAADVRRFHAGQLVAAHHYTRRQRLGRFARRYRGMLIVAAIAVASLTALAGFSVRRVIAARDLAEADRRATLAANAQLVERNDQLVIASARAVVESNPTHAIAILKQIRPDSARLDDARAVAQAAVARGVAWSMPSPQEPYVGRLNADGSRFALHATSGALRIYDLELRRTTVANPDVPRSTIEWIGLDHVLMTDGDGVQRIIDARTGAIVTGPGVPATVATAARAPHALVHTAAGLALLDARTGTRVPVPTDRAVQAFALGADASWYAVLGAGVITLHDAQHRELLRAPAATTTATLAVAPAGRTVAFQAGDGVVECTVDPEPRCTPLALGLAAGTTFASVGYVERSLQVVTSQFFVWRRFDGRWIPLDRPPEAHFLPNLSSPGLLCRSGDGGVFANVDAGGFTVHPPVDTHNAVMGIDAAGRRLVMATEGGTLVVYELGEFAPRLVATDVMDMHVLSSRALLVTSMANDYSSRVDLATGERGARTSLALIGGRIEQRTASGHVLLHLLVETGISRLVRLRADTAHADAIVAGPAPFAVLAGESVVFGTGDSGVVQRATTGGPARELLRFEGIAVGAVQLDDTHAVVISDRGELATVDVATGAVARRAAPIGPQRIGTDGRGRLVAYAGAQLSRVEPTRLVPLATLDQPITGLRACPGGVCVAVENQDVFQVNLDTGATRRVMFAAGRPTVANDDGTLIASSGAGNRVELTELPALLRWSRPIYPGGMQVTPAVQGRELFERWQQRVVRWPLPQAPPDLGRWLHERTNAHVDPADGMFGWQ